MDGFAALAQARAQGIVTPILLLTARDSISDRVHGLQLGADDYLVKPFAFAELLARLQAIHRRAGPHRETVLAAGNVTIDPVAHRVLVGDEPVDLSQKQFALLELLLRHRGQVVTRTMILERIFGYTFSPNTNIVDVHISNLRQKLALPACRLRIETIRGVGYRVDAGADA
jgi:two-component system OmpR family response regulator